MSDLSRPAPRGRPPRAGVHAAFRNIENALTWIPLALATVIGAAQIVFRAFGHHLLWSEEAVIYLVVLSTYIGAAVLVRDNGHISMQVIGPFLRDRGKWVMDLIGTVVATAYYMIVVWLSIQLVTDPAVLNTVTRVLKLPLWAVDLTLVVGFALMTFHALKNFVTLIRSRKPLPALSEIELALSESDGPISGTGDRP